VIYEYPDEHAPLRQGDIFSPLPRVDLSLEQMVILDDPDLPREVSWEALAGRDQDIVAVVPLRPVAAIVATQDCDASRAPDITLCEIRPFREVERKSRQTSAAKKWVSIITQHARINLKWFYLPPDDRLGFTDKMGVDFMMTLRVQRIELEKLKRLRRGRLNQIAQEHFRERIAEFFRRYPYDEWYPLNPEEFQAYAKDYPEARPFAWQTQTARQETATLRTE